MLFDLTLPDTLAKEDPDKSYINSSPLSTYGDDLNRGDAHYWLIWWGGADIINYEVRLGRFNSEFGMQSLLPMSSIEQFIPLDERSSTDSPTMRYHNKMGSGMSLIAHYTGTLFNVTATTSMDDLSYLSMCTQAIGVGVRLESSRRNVPFTMGALFWQFNDVWPVFSWSSIDFYGQWKALHYKARDLFRNVMISIKLEQGNFPKSLYGANNLDKIAGEDTKYTDEVDDVEQIVELDRHAFIIAILNENLVTLDKVIVELDLLHTNGKKISSKKITNMSLPSNNNTLFRITFPRTLKILPDKYYVRGRIIHQRLYDKKLLAHNFFFYQAPKDIFLPRPDYSVDYDLQAN